MPDKEKYKGGYSDAKAEEDIAASEAYFKGQYKNKIDNLYANNSIFSDKLQNGRIEAKRRLKADTAWQNQWINRGRASLQPSSAKEQIASGRAASKVDVKKLYPGTMNRKQVEAAWAKLKREAKSLGPVEADRRLSRLEYLLDTAEN